MERVVHSIGEVLADIAARSERDRAIFEAAYRAGYAAGHDVGYGRAQAEMERDWKTVAAQVRGYANTPAQAVLEARRWGPGGREHFGDRRPGDFPG